MSEIEKLIYSLRMVKSRAKRDRIKLNKRIDERASLLKLLREEFQEHRHTTREQIKQLRKRVKELENKGD